MTGMHPTKELACFRHPSGKHPRIVVVDNTNDAGTGSLRWAKNISTDEQGKIIAFERSGRTKANAAKEFIIHTPFTTVLGQTAPNPGFTFSQANFSVKTSDCDFMHMKFRGGDDHHRDSYDNADCVVLATGKSETSRVRFIQCSMSWAIDEIGHVTGHYSKKTSKDVDFYRCLITSALSHSLHSKGEHSKGLLFGAVKDLYVKECLFYGTRDRNPLISGVSGYHSTVAIINSLFHGIDSPVQVQPNSGTEYTLAICGNHFQDNRSWFFTKNRPLPKVRIYAKDNLLSDGSYVDGDDLTLPPGSDPDAIVDKWPQDRLAIRLSGPDNKYIKPGDPRNWDPYYDARSVRHRVTKLGGARPADRDPIDTHILNAVRHKTYADSPDNYFKPSRWARNDRGEYINSVSQTVGWDERTRQHRLDLPSDDNIIPWIDHWTDKAMVKGY